MGRARLTIFILATLASVAWGSNGKNKPKLDVDLFVGWGECYRPMEWIPMLVEIKQLNADFKEPFEGTLTLTSQQDDLTRMRIHHPIIVMPDMLCTAPLAAKLAVNAPECDLVITDARGRGQWSRTDTLWSRRRGDRLLTAVEEESLLIGVTGRPGFGLMSLDQGAHGAAEGRQGRIYVKSRKVRELPWDWTGYASLDLLVMYNVEWDKIQPGQSQALLEWVSNGGSVLIVPGGRPLSPRHPLARLLPFQLGPARQAPVSASAIRQWGANVPGGESATTLPFWTIPDTIGSGWTTTTVPRVGGGAVPVYAHGPVGFGQVGVLVCDLSKLGSRQGSNVAPFWVNRIRPLLRGREIKLGRTGGNEDRQYGWHEHRLGQTHSATNTVLEHLLDIPELRPLSIWVVIVLLTGLAVVIGPVDYLVLKRLGRLPLTWVTSASCVAVFTAGAYYGVQALRSGTVQVRAVSVVDGIKGMAVTGGGDGTDRVAAWATTYSGIFAPSSSDYELDRLTKRQWWSSVVPTQQSHYSYREQTATRQITCVQGDGANLPVSVPINIWTMQTLITEEPLTGMPFDVRLKRDGYDVTVTVINHSEYPVTGGTVRIGGGRMMRLGAVEGFATGKFTGRLVPGESWRGGSARGERWGSYRGGAGSFNGEQAYFASGTRRRTLAIEEYLKRGAAVVCLEYGDRERVWPGFGLKKRKRDLHHIRMARMVVPAEKDATR